MTPTRFQTPIGTYSVTAVLREAPAASTYEVRRESDGEVFVLKQLNIANLKHWKQFDLFEREVESLKAIEHPFVPRWVDSYLDEDAGVFVSVQTRVQGVTLKHVLATSGGMTAPDVENYLRQALGILMHLHERAPQIVHRDINPSNVMIAEGQLYLIDFGAVKMGGDESTSMTTVGTFGYMAPEQILGRADVQSDLYGLGMTMITMATGCEPHALPQNPSTGQIDPSSVLRVSPSLAHALVAMIRPGVAERPASARAVLAQLDQPAAMQMAHYGAASAQHPGLVPAPHVHREISPYTTPEALSESDRKYLAVHQLQKFPVWLAVTLHFFTWGLFSIFFYGSQHDKLPVAKRDDPSGAKAIGFSFLPYYNFYWSIFQPMRLADRLNLQDRIRNRPAGLSRGFMMACSIMGIIPYINFLLGVPLWGVGVYKFQKQINALAEERDSQSDLPPALPPVPED